MRHPFLGGLDSRTFLSRHWQKKPLLVRGAFPAFSDPIDARGVLALARSPDAASRLVHRAGARWFLEHGPIRASRLQALPRRNWTVLVQDTNLFSERAAAFLEQFDFLPRARIDDLMVSYAVPGGSVGPHVDSYDVFLVQGRGRRRWQVSGSRDHAFRAGLPLKILQRFEPDDEWVLEPGDMLYLPPGIPHCGVALTECLTWSVGFRAPADRELVSAFLDFLHERLEPQGQYADPRARPAARRGAVPAPLERHASRVLGRIRWSASQVREFLGEYLSDPKAHVVFDPPARTPAAGRFAALGSRRGLALDLRSILLFSGSMFFINGQALRAPPGTTRWLRRLADDRRLAPPVDAPQALWELARDWHSKGYLHIDGEGRS